MKRGRRAAQVIGAVAASLSLALPGTAVAGGPGKWTPVGTSDNAADTFGVLRTVDQNLHLVWLAKRAANLSHSYATATISVTGQLRSTGTALAGWDSLLPDPRLVANGLGIRLIFNGSTGPPSGCYARGTVFTATTSNGSNWSLVSGSLDHGTAGTGNIAATVESDHLTPVAAFSGGHLFHVGVDPACPAAAADGTINPTPGSVQTNPAAVTDTKTGAVYVAWFQGFEKWGYWVARILPTQSAPTEAPHSGANQTPFENNQPLEPVALAARLGGGVYMAYCVANAHGPCSHIDLWKVGSSKIMVVPGSQNVQSARVALTADTLGNMSVAWFSANGGSGVIHEVRTNPAVTAWGTVRTLSPPPGVYAVDDLQAEGSAARVDLLVAGQLNQPTPVGLFQTQVLQGLLVTARPASFSHKNAKQVTFKVTDAGQPISGAKVSCLGKSGKTTAKGTVTLSFKKGEPKGKHQCTAAHVFYAVGTVTLKVT